MTTFKSIIEMNKTKLMEKCFELLIENFIFLNID